MGPGSGPHFLSGSLFVAWESRGGRPKCLEPVPAWQTHRKLLPPNQSSALGVWATWRVNRHTENLPLCLSSSL